MKTGKIGFSYSWIIVAASACVIFVMYGTMITFGIFFEPVLNEFGWTRAMTAGAFSLVIFVRGSLYAVTGRLTDKYGPRIVVTTCGFLLGAGYLLISQVTSLWHFYLLYTLVGIGMGSALIPQVSTIARWFARRRGLALGIASSGEGLGMLVMVPVARWLLSIYDWRSAYIIVGAIALVLVSTAAQFLRHNPSQMGLSPYGETEIESPIPKATGLSLRETIHTREFWLLATVYFCFIFAWTPYLPTS